MAGKAKIGAGIALDGEKEFKSAISSINKDLTVLKSALEKNKSEFEANGKSTELLNNKLKILSNQYDTQKSKVEALKSALEHAQKNYAKYGTDVEKLKNSLSEAEKAMEEMKKSSSTTKEELSEQEKKIASIKDELKRAERGYNSAENAIKDWQSSINRTETDLNKTKKAINDTEKELEEFTVDAKKAGKAAKEAGEKAEKSSHDWGKLTSKVGGGITKFAKVTAVIGGALGALGGLGIKVGAEFEAGMSEVKAISQATAEEMEKLTDKAKEMGAETKFSASESAEAFKYMAQAGWEPQEMLDGIAGVMSLAAASGEELALTSDIVTDSLTAFGLQAKDASHFADVLAITATKSNTNVAALGETFKYVAPVAGALQYSVEDVGVAIGLMANRSIKGEQAGTALRTMLTNLAKPTNQMAGYMQQLNLSITDTQGNVKPFNQLLVEMRDSFSGLTEAQKAEYAAGIAGKEAMSGLLAIVNASDEEFNSLTEQINNCAGAADRTAKIMQDNLKGSVEQLGGACETLGIAFYESVNNPLKDITQTATGMVERLTKAFEKNGLSGLISEFGSVFADMVTKAAENAPKMIDVAIEMLQSFLSGIQNNSGKIADAAVNIGKSLIEGLVKVIPSLFDVGVDMIAALSSSLLSSDIGRSVKELGDDIMSVFKTIAEIVKKVFDSLKPIFENFVRVILNIAKSVLPALSKAFEGLSKVVKPLVPILVAAGTAFAGFKIVKSLSTMVGDLTTTLKKVKDAQKLWNLAMQENPIGAVITAVGIFTGAIAGLAFALGGEASEHQKLIEQINKETQARADNYREAQNTYEAQMADIDNARVLKRELDTLVDANGKVKDGYLERAEAITEKLTEASGIEFDIVDGTIDKYDELGRKLDEVFIKKQATALAEAYQESGRIAQENIDKARKDHDDALARMEELNSRYVEQVIDGQVKLIDTAAKVNGEAIYEADEHVKANFYATREEVEKTGDILNKYASDVSNASYTMQIATSGSVEEMKNMISNFQYTVDESGNIRKKSTQESLADFDNTIKVLQDRLNETTEQSQRDALESTIQQTKQSRDILANSMVDTISLIDSNGEQFQISFEQLMTRGSEGITNGKVATDLAMQENMISIITAIADSELPVEEKMKKITEVQQMVLRNATPEAAENQKKILGSIISAISESNPSIRLQMQSFIDSGLITIDSETNKTSAYNRAKAVAGRGNDGFGSVDTTSSGNNFILGFVRPMFSKENLQLGFNAGYGLGLESRRGLNVALDEHSPSRESEKSANFFVEGFVIGIKRNTVKAAQSVKRMGNLIKENWGDSIKDFSTESISPRIENIQSKLRGINNLDKTLKLSVDVPKSVNTKTVSSTQISPTFVIQIDKFVNNRPGDVQSFAQELDFYARNANLARGLT